MSISRSYCKKMLSSITIAVVLVSVFVAVVNISMIPPAKADPDWLTGWQYRKSHVINGAAGAGTDYQVRITVHYGSGTDSSGDVYCNSHCKIDFGDVRFAAADGSTLLNYWMESSAASNNAVFWIEVAGDLSSSSQTIYVYYGNSGAATVSNGIDTFRLFEHPSPYQWVDDAGNNPVLQPSPGEWDAADVVSASIIKDGSTYFMYYEGNSAGSIWDDAQIGVATSTDGVHWTKYSGNPIILRTGSGWKNSLVNPVVCKVGNTFYMMYTGVQSNYVSAAFLATSSDGYSFVDYSSSPVLDDTDAWINRYLETGGLSYFGGYFYLYYCRNALGGTYRNTGVARSTDCITWTKSPSNPVVTTSEGGYGTGSGASTIDAKVVKWGTLDGAPQYLMLIAASSNAFTLPGSWTVKQPLPRGVADMAIGVYDGKIYVIGGYGVSSSDYRNDVQVYDPSSNTWTSKTAMPTARWGPMAVCAGSKIYVFGGLTSAGLTNKLEVYDPASDTWDTTKSSMPYSMRCGECVYDPDNGLIYLIGGMAGGSESKKIFSYNPATDAYDTSLTDCPVGQEGATCAYTDGKIYAIGGLDDLASGATKDFNSNYVYTISSNSWSTKTLAPQRKEGQSGYTGPSIMGDYIYYTHGMERGISPATFYKTTFRYQISTDSWVQLADANYERDGCGSAVVNGKLYVIAGRNSAGSPAGLNYLEEFDPSASSPPQIHLDSLISSTPWFDSSRKWNPKTNGNLFQPSVGCDNPCPVQVLDSNGDTIAYQNNLSITYTDGVKAYHALYNAGGSYIPFERWQRDGETGTWAVANNKIEDNGNVVDSDFLYSNLDTDNIRACATLYAPTNDYYNAYLVARRSGTSSYLIIFRQGHAGTGPDVRIFKRVSNTYTQIGTTVSQALNNGDKLEFRVYGATTVTLEGYVNGVLVISGTDSSSTFKSGTFGLAAWESSAQSWVSDFDNVYVTKYVSPEPSHGTWGTEETAAVMPTLQLSPTSKTCRKYGETFTTQISVTNALTVTDFKFEIHYNATLLDYTNMAWYAWGSGTITVDEPNGNITGITSGSAISGTQTLVAIQFSATYQHIWKDESKVSGWKNDQYGIILIQWANLSRPSGPDLGYIQGGAQNQINVGPDVMYTFSPIKGDIDNNGAVDVFDLRTVAAYYDQPNPTYDLNGDGIIDIFDLVGIGANYGFIYP